MNILTGADLEDIAIRTSDPVAWRHSAAQYLNENNFIKYAECLRQEENARIYMNDNKYISLRKKMSNFFYDE